MMTATQHVEAFIEHCTVLRQGYFFKFNKKSSSLRGFIKHIEAVAEEDTPRAQRRQEEINTLEKLNRTSPKDHVKYKPAIKSLFAVWGTTNDYVRIDEHGQQAITVKYWQTDGHFSDVNLGIAISSRYPGYHEHVRTHLNALYRTSAGKILLDEISNAPANKCTVIIDHELSNQCGSMGSTNGMKAIAKELMPEHATKLLIATKTALDKINPGPHVNKYAWLADKINQTPRYQLKGAPATAPANLNVTESMVRDWILNDRSIWNDYDNDRDCNQIKNSVILALYNHDTNGSGAKSMVNYSLGNANPLNAERPPAIGLAHELVHAYYNMRGEQPGFEVENFSTVFFEYRCVGLGPWNNDAVCENKIREEWMSAIEHFDSNDARNRKSVPRRDVYGA
jgi:hypothetical protein